MHRHVPSGAKLDKSAHAALVCSSCSIQHEGYPHPADTPRVFLYPMPQGQEAAYNREVNGKAVKKGNGATPDCSLATAEWPAKAPETGGIAPEAADAAVSCSLTPRHMPQCAVTPLASRRF
jgi:hypothetical protein